MFASRRNPKRVNFLTLSLENFNRRSAVSLYFFLVRYGRVSGYQLQVECSIALHEEHALRRLVAACCMAIVSARLHQVRARTKPELRFSVRSLDVHARHNHDL